ncbi:MAG: hypothetical protein ACHQRM_14155 [Bacteroidia bacterium]
MNNPDSGARSLGLGGASVCITDLWSLSNNPAGLGFIKSTEAGTWYENRFLVQALQSTAFGIAVPSKHGSFGLLLSGFGYESYSENTAGFAYSKALGKKLSGGVRLDYRRTSIAEGYGASNEIIATIGLLARIQPTLYLGAELYNPARTRLIPGKEERIPALLKVGLMYMLSPHVKLCLETQKNTITNPDFMFGIEYEPSSLFMFRAGITSLPSSCSMGAGLRYHNLKFDFASVWQPATGFIPSIGLAYVFSKETVPH